MGAGCCHSRVHFCCSQTYKNPFNSKKSNQLNRVSPGVRRVGIPFALFFLLVALSIDSVAQLSDNGTSQLIRGAIVTAQGQPVPDATVEVRDLRGIQIGKSFTNSAGRFEINAAAMPGRYIVLAATLLQTGAEPITIGQSEFDVRIALPTVAEATAPAGYTVSANDLGAPAKAIKHLEEAQRRFRKKDLRGAAVEIDRALEIDPVYAKAYAMRAFVALAGKEWEGAIGDALRATALDSSNSESYLALATAYNTRREFHKAMESARQALSISPGVWQARLEIAKSLYGQDQYVAALSVLDQVDTDFPDVHLVRADVLMRLGRCEEADQEFTLFLSQAPNDPRDGQIRKILATAQ